MAEARLRRDLFFGFFAGLAAALFLLPVLRNLGIRFPFQHAFVFLGLPLGSLLWVFLGRKFAREKPSLFELVKFVVTGGLNTTIDFGILNLFILATGEASGLSFSLFKSVSFIAANINSYFWNKFWTFAEKDAVSSREYAKFFGVSILGLIINVAVSSLVVNVAGPQFGLSEGLWANVGAAAGAAAGLLLNFVGYKFVVFER